MIASLSVSSEVSGRVSIVVSMVVSIVVSRADSRGISIVVSTEGLMVLSVISIKVCLSVSLGASMFGVKQEAMNTTNARQDILVASLKAVRVSEFSI